MRGGFVNSEVDRQIDNLQEIILTHPNIAIAARACINALQIMLGGADALVMDEDGSGEISSIVIGTADLVESSIEWADVREVEVDYLEGLSEAGLEGMH
jgi:hypothetical protein